MCARRGRSDLFFCNSLPLQKGFYIKELASSPIRGGDGNIEYVSYFSNKDNDIKSINIEEIIKEAFKEQKSK